MISFAKKILVNGRTTAAQPHGGDAEVRKYSLTSTHEAPSPISGTSFALNPEHLYATTYRLNWSDRTNSEEDAVLKTDRVASNPNMVDGMVDPTAEIMWPGASNPDTLVRSNPVEVICKQPSGAVVYTPELQPDNKDLGDDGSSINQSNENLTHVATTNSLAPSEATHRSLHQEGEYCSWRRVRSSDTEQRQSSDERISETQMHNKSSRGSSPSSVTDDILGSHTTVSDVPAVSTSSLDVLETSTRFQQARRKQRKRELKLRRKTLEIFYFDGKSTDAVANKMSWSQSKSLTPSPTNLEPGCVDLRPRRSKSRLRRHTIDGLVCGSDAVASPEDQILGDPPLFWNVLWPAGYSSSDEVISDVSKGDQRGKVVPAEGARRAPGVRKASLSATVICVSDMIRSRVIADLDLLEEDTEFEPCAVPFENTVVLWPAAVDKPSCFESSRCFRSWIISLEAAGFIGSECLLLAPVMLSQGLHEHSQLLFLFPRHLLFTEQKSYSMLKLDQKVAVGDLWLSTRKEDMVEVLDVDSAWDGSRSFVLGWPPTNTVVTFCTSEEKALWVAKIEELIEVENAKEKDSSQQLAIKILHKERGYVTRTRELTVAKSENSYLVLQRCILEFHLEVSSSKEFQLCVRCGKDQALQPLLGHESPFLIEAWFRSFATRKDGSHGNCFVLRERKRTKPASRDAVGGRRASKTALRSLFKRSLTWIAKSVPLFGISLSEICVDGLIPGRIQALFRFLYEHGPSTDGVFRKPGGHKEVSDFKLHLNSTDEVNFENVSVHVVASVVKEWLRNLPDCLLSCDLYLQWIDVSKISEVALVHEELRRLSSSLPASHLLVLRHLMCVLHRIQLHSKQNRMTPFNLAVCFGPNVLHPHQSTSIDLQLTSVEVANAVIRMLIEAIEPVLGSDCIELYQDVADPRLIQEFDVDGSYEFRQSVSTEHSFAQDSTDLPTADSLESLDSLRDNPPVAESGQLLESMSPDSGLAASDPQLYEEDQPISETPSRGRYLRRKRQLHWKSEQSDVSESQATFDSDVGSLISKASEGSESVPGTLQMHEGRNVDECLEQFQTAKPDSKELMSSLEGQFSFSDDQSASDVSALEASSESERPASVIKADKNETMSLCYKADVSSAAHDETEQIAKGEKNYDCDDKRRLEPIVNGETEWKDSNLEEEGLKDQPRVSRLNDQSAPPATETSEQNIAKDGFPSKDEAVKKPPEALMKKPPTSQFHLTSIEVVSSQIVSTTGDTLLQTIGSVQSRPTKQETSPSVVKSWVKKMEERQSENISQGKQNSVTFGINQKAGSDNPNRQVVTNLAPEAVTRKLEKGQLEDLPDASSKVEKSGKTLKTSGDPEPCRVPVEICEQRPITLNLSEKDHSHKMLVVSQKNCAKETVPMVFGVAQSAETESHESRNCSQQMQLSESITVSKQTDHPDSRKAYHQTKLTKQTDSSESRKVSKQIDSSESATVSKQINSPDLRKANRHKNYGESTCFVSVQSSPKSKMNNSELQDDKRSWAGHSGCQEKYAEPLRQNDLAGPCVKSTKISTDKNTIVARSNDQRNDGRSRVGCEKVGRNSRFGETEWRDKEYKREDQLRGIQAKVQPTERRLKDQSKDGRVRNDRLKIQLWSSDDKWRFEQAVSGETEWKDSSLEEHGLKYQPRVSRVKDQSRDSRLRDQSRDSRLKDQSRRSRLKVQPRTFDDNWRLERDSENFEPVTCTRFMTSAYPQNITSVGCRATMATAPGHSPRHASQNREPKQNVQPACSTDRFGARRSVTIIQLCNDDSVITQKTVKMT